MLKIITFSVVLVSLALLPDFSQAFSGMASQQNGAQSAEANQASSIKGKVIETMNAGGYTYVCIEHGSQNQWAAMPATEVKVGDDVEITSGMKMHNFTSKSLNRTFATIIFSGGLKK